MDGARIVFHLASIINAPREQYDIYWKNNVFGTFNLLKAAQKAKLKRFVYCSSVGVMGHLREVPANEETPCHPDNHYGKSKYEAENLVRSFGAKHGIPISIIRPSWTYGPNDRRTLKLFSAVKKRRFVIIGDGRTLVHPVHVTDVVQGILCSAFMQQSVNGTYIIAGNETVTLRKLMDTIAAQLNVRIPNFRLPVLIAGIAAFFFEKLYLPFGKTPPISKRRLEFFLKDQSFEITKAMKEMGYRPKKNLKEGMRETIEWYHRKNLI